ncbi:sensor histidine kinase [Microbacterium aurum]
MFRRLTRTQLVIDIVVAGLFALVALPFDLSIGRFNDNNALGTVLVALLMGGALALRRAAPGLALTVAWVGAIVQMAMARPPSTADIAVFGVLYATAAYGSRRTFWAGLASTFVGALVITIYLFAPLTDGGLSVSTITTALAVALAAMFGLGLAWTVGALVRTGIRARENRRAQEVAEAEAAAESERTRIARDMHDVVAHSLAVVIAQADGARYASASDPDAAAFALGTISTTARAALSDVRMLLAQLRHRQADGPQPTLADLEQLYAQVRAAGIALWVDVDPAPAGEVPTGVQLAVYRILQEALTNALRHGAGAPVDVALAWHADRVELSVRNETTAPGAPASGTPAGEGEAPRGHGVIGMRERAQLVGGTLDAGREGGDFVVRATLPIGGGE